MNQMKKLFILLGIFSFLLVVKEMSAQPFTNFPKEEAFNSFVKAQMKQDKIPGLSVGFVKDGKFWAKGYGYIDLENNVSADKYSAYRLASNTKSMTAAAILKLYEDNKLDLDDPVSEYVSYFPNKKWEVTIRQVLGHIGGISHYKNYEKEGHIKTHKSTKEAVEIFDDFDLVAKPGTEFNYSSYGYNLLGAVIEEVSEMPYEAYLREYIWKPLEMNHIYMDEPNQIIKNRAEGYRLIFGEIKNSEFVNITSRFAAGGTCASVVDLLKYANGLNNAEILSENTIRLMESTMNLGNGISTGYGMGWSIQPVNGHYMVYHTGGQPETRTMLVRFPERDYSIAVAYNLEGGDLRAFSKRLYQLVMNEGWNIKPYADNGYDQTLLDGLRDVYNYGLASFKRNGYKKNDSIDIVNVFSYLNNTLNRDSLYENYEVTRTKIQYGRHPRADKAYVWAGKYMASELAEHYGEEKLDEYHKKGAIAFFKDYIDLANTNEEVSPQINASLSEMINEINTDWEETWNDYTRGLWFASYTDLEEQMKELRELFKGKKIVPDFTEQLASAIRERAIDRGLSNALPLAKEFTALYPESAIPQLVLSQIYVLEKNAEKAENAMALSLNATRDQDAASAKNIKQYAEWLFERDYLDEALILLRVAEKFYPEAAVLHELKGDIYLEKSRRQFQKALQINPTFHDTQDKLDKIE